MMKEGIFRKGLVFTILILFIGMSFTSVAISNKISCVNFLYTSHDPIYINGNDNFTSENGVSGGSGTYNNPYIIEGWEINASSNHGIIVVNVNVYFKICNCYIHDGGVNNDGIVFKNVTNGKIIDGIITNNNYGIIFREQDYPWQTSSYNTIQNNTITDNSKDGIHFEHTLTGHHSYNLIFLNEISGNDQGIFMVMSAYNQIFSNNIVSNSRWGVNLTECMGGGKYNKVYHNNFIDNGNENGQACVWWTLDNDWDDGYPSGGNFWSDYDGVDNFSGPNQNITGSDGIGDTPYNITLYDEGNNYYLYPFDYDYYPLIEPWSGNLPPPSAEFTWTPSPADPMETILFNASESIDYDGFITLFEWDWDNDGEYDENHTSSIATHAFEEIGYYPVTLRVTDNDNLTDIKTKIIRVGNHPPNMPNHPYPPDGRTNVSISVDLSWGCYDPDGDQVTFDVYFGTTSPPPRIVSNWSKHSYDLGTLNLSTTYFWKIVAWDYYGASTAGPIWNFTTRGNQLPDAPTITGPTRGKAGVEYQYNFSLSDLDHDAMYLRVDWGNGTPSPWHGPYGHDKTVKLSHTWNQKGTFTIRAQAKDICGGESDWGTLIVTMPVNQQINQQSSNQLLLKMVQRVLNFQ